MRVLDSGVLKTHWLLNRRPRSVRFHRVGDWRSHVESVKETLRSGEIAVYVHIPYCKFTCMFCPYFRKVLKSQSELDVYLNAVLREIQLYGKVLEDLNLSVVEIHVGGGTPSLVPPKFYRQLHEKLAEFFTVKTGIGIEVNPEDFQDSLLVEEFYACGVDEVSIGVQSFDSRVLKSLGRRHRPEDNVKAIENSVRTGFKWINVDLMFLTPSIKGYVELKLEEKLSAFKRDLEISEELRVHQVTYYPTIVPKYSPGYRLLELGKLSQEVDSIEDFVVVALDFAESRKLHLTRVYSLSRKPYEYATVNLEMIGPLLGFGAGAWSNTGYYQYINVHSVEEYIGLISENYYPAVFSRRLAESSVAWRLLFDQLSTGRVDYGVFRDLGIKLTVGQKFLLKLMELAGLAEKTSNGYKLTRRGIIEVYKSTFNYVADFPVKATGILSQYSDLNKLPVNLVI